MPAPCTPTLAAGIVRPFVALVGLPFPRGIDKFCARCCSAYVNGKRRGVSKEEPFEYGQTLLPEIQDFADDPDEPDDSSGVFSEWRKQAVTKLIKPFWPAPADKVKAARKNRMIESLNEFLLENDAETAFVNPEKELELALKCRAAREPVDEKLPVEEKQREEEKQRVEEKQRMELLGHMR